MLTGCSLLLTSIFSAGNTYFYCAIRTLYSLALEGRAPRFLTHTTRKGVPIYCFAVVMIFPLLSFLQVSNSSSVVITWFANLVTAGGTFSVSFFQPSTIIHIANVLRPYQLYHNLHHLYLLPPCLQSTKP